MDKALAGLLGAVGALVVAAPGHAAPVQPARDVVARADSYAVLLQPVPDAVATLKAMEEADLSAGADVVQVQYHHHHHRRYYRRRRHHHSHY